MRVMARAASMALLALALVLGVDRLFAPSDLVVALLAACAAGAVTVFCVSTLWPLRRSPSDNQVARFVERALSRAAGSAGQRHRSRRDANRPSAVACWTMRRAARAASIGTVWSPRGRSAGPSAGGVGATAALATLLIVGADVVDRIARSAWLYAAPFGATLVVEPGDARLVAGESLEVRARLADTLGAFGRSAPRVTVIDGGGGRFALAMQPRDGGYAATLPPAARSFTYRGRRRGRSNPTTTR